MERSGPRDTAQVNSDTNAEKLREWAEAWEMNPTGGPLVDRSRREADLVSHFDPEITYRALGLARSVATQRPLAREGNRKGSRLPPAN